MKRNKNWVDIYDEDKLDIFLIELEVDYGLIEEEVKKEMLRMFKLLSEEERLMVRYKIIKGLVINGGDKIKVIIKELKDVVNGMDKKKP